MRRILGMCLVIGNLFGASPCKGKEEICVYYWRGGGYTSEVRVANTTAKKILIENLIVTIDYKMVTIENQEVEAYQNILISKIEHKDPSKEKEPIFNKYKFKYKYID